ncbi:9241_t:CDS:1, partial [Gigaspora margarita]
NTVYKSESICSDNSEKKEGRLYADSYILHNAISEHISEQSLFNGQNYKEILKNKRLDETPSIETNKSQILAFTTE